MKELRRYFLTGVATMLPLSVTVFIFWFIVVRLGNLFLPLFRIHPWLERVPGWGATLAGFVFFLIIVLVVGALASGIIGRLVLGWLDKLMKRVPIVKIIYSSARQFTDAVFVSRDTFRKTVIAQYPRQGMFAVGFLTSEDRIALADGRKALFVFFPTTPSPTTGWLALIPEDEVTETSISIEAGLKLIISGGVIRPANIGYLVRPEAGA
ncbi:MAG: DUF502 domain-containing protein [candidate division WOR-3 bacterium]|nr:DUF502 domain-containing protein [candidate division WOR-3 bacterium]